MSLWWIVDFILHLFHDKKGTKAIVQQWCPKKIPDRNQDDLTKKFQSEQVGKRGAKVLAASTTTRNELFDFY